MLAIKTLHILQRFSQTAGWILLAAIVVLSVEPAPDRPITPVPHGIEHFGIFVVTGAAFGFGYARYSVCSMGLFIFAGAIEIVQIFLPDRHARLSDFIVDAI